MVTRTRLSVTLYALCLSCPFRLWCSLTLLEYEHRGFFLREKTVCGLWLSTHLNVLRFMHVDIFLLPHTWSWYGAELRTEYLCLRCHHGKSSGFNPLKPELNPICYLLALLAHHFLHVSRIRVKSLTIRLLMLYIYGAPILDVSRSHTTTQHSR